MGFPGPVGRDTKGIIMAASIQRIVWGEFRLDGGSVFGVVPRPLWVRRVTPDEANQIPIQLTSLLVTTGSHKVLLECGMWPGFSQKMSDEVYRLKQGDMRQILAEQAGIAPEEITDAIPTHLHFDHVGGFFEKKQGVAVPAFPNARLHVQRRQLEWAKSPSVKDTASYVPELTQAILETRNLIVHDDAWRFDENLSISLAQGHTPDMALFEIETEFGKLFHSADVVFLEAAVPVAWVGAFDIRPLDTVAEKESLYARAEGSVLYLGHEPVHPYCRVTRGERGRWMATPVEWPPSK